MAAQFETVAVQYDDELGIGYLTLDRPEALNALNPQLMGEIVEGLEWLESENEDVEGVALRAVVVDGAGDKAFSSGADVDEFSDSTSTETSSRSFGEFVRDFPAPVIAKIQGYCLGGGLELAFAFDFRFASEDSTFGLPEVDLGIIPGAGGIQYVTRLASPAVAKELIMTGEHFSADRAAEEGLIHDTYPVDELDDEVQSFVEKIAAKAPLAIQATKDSVDIAMQTGLREGLEYDRRRSTMLLNTEDAKEGGKAFTEDREPEFVGK